MIHYNQQININIFQQKSYENSTSKITDHTPFPANHLSIGAYFALNKPYFFINIYITVSQIELPI